MITLKQLKDKLEKDFGWENLDCEDNKWFVDHLLNDAIEAIEVIHCCKSDSELLKDKETITVEEWLFDNDYKKLFDYYVKNGKTFTESELMQIYKDLPY